MSASRRSQASKCARARGPSRAPPAAWKINAWVSVTAASLRTWFFRPPPGSGPDLLADLERPAQRTLEECADIGVGREQIGIVRIDVDGADDGADGDGGHLASLARLGDQAVEGLAETLPSRGDRLSLQPQQVLVRQGDRE